MTGYKFHYDSISSPYDSSGTDGKTTQNAQTIIQKIAAEIPIIVNIPWSNTKSSQSLLSQMAAYLLVNERLR